MTLFCKITITIKPEHITNIQELIFTTDLLGTKSCRVHFEIKKLKRRQSDLLEVKQDAHGTVIDRCQEPPKNPAQLKHCGLCL